MSYSKLDKALRDEIKANDLNKKEQDKLRQHLTALNNLSKNELINVDSFGFDMTDGLDQIVEKYAALRKEQKKSDIYGDKTRVRNLAKFYVELTNFNTDNLTFSEIMQEGLRRKYGTLDIFFQGEFTPKEQVAVKKKYKTYREVCIKMVEVGVNNHPELWPRIDISDPNLTKTQLNKKLDSAGRIVRDWVTGDSIPASHTSRGRLSFIESYLGLPKDCLVNKAGLINQRTSTLKNTEKRTESQKRSRVNNFVVKKLNAEFQNYYEEYSEYKINSKQPEIINITKKI